MKIDWFTKLLLKVWPRLAMRQLANEMGVNSSLFDRAHKVFSQVDRIDFFPFQSGQRGFIIILDKQTALYFYQDGDHFVYDGFEMGKYDKGDVSILDNIRR